MARLRPKRRQHRCYELAWRYLAYDDRFAEWTLVHGAISSRIDCDPIGHAWLQKDDTIYDPVTNRKSDLLDWVAENGAKAICSYSHAEAMRIGGESGHYGPWHNVQVRHY